MKATTFLLSLLPTLALTLPTASSGPPSSYPRTLRARDQQDDINAVIALILSIFPLNVALQDGAALLTAAEALLAKTFGIKTTESAVATSQACADLTIVYARGTTEPGNVGVLVGPWFFDTIEEKLGGRKSVAVQGVEYPATVEGYLLGNSTGTAKMANYISTALTRCPNTKLVMSGYSQGAQVVHNAAAALPAATMAKVSSVVTFGDPKSDEKVAGADSKTLILCNKADNICDGGVLILPDHVTYVAQVGAAADYVLSKAGF